MKDKQAEELLMKIDLAFGLTKEDFQSGHVLYTIWPGTKGKNFNIEDLGDYSLKISKNLGDIYIDKISTDKWIIVGKGTTLHCDDLHAGESVIRGFEGYLM